MSFIEGLVKVLAYKKLFISGFILTMELVILDVILSTIVGALCALIMTSKNQKCIIKLLKVIVRIYIELFRGSPLLLQIFFIYYGLGYLGVDMPLFGSCLLSLTLHHGAYIAEIFRSGIESVPKGQYEAGACLGLSKLDIMFRIVMPQAFKIFLPPLIGYYIGAIKDTPLVSIVGLADMVKNGRNIMAATVAPLQTYLVIAVIYFCVCYPLSLYVRWLENKRKAAY